MLDIWATEQVHQTVIHCLQLRVQYHSEFSNLANLVSEKPTTHKPQLYAICKIQNNFPNLKLATNAPELAPAPNTFTVH